MTALTLSQIFNVPEIHKYTCVDADGVEIIGIMADATDQQVKLIVQSIEEDNI